LYRCTQSADRKAEDWYEAASGRARERREAGGV
jgi:hypothetical protein